MDKRYVTETRGLFRVVVDKRSDVAVRKYHVMADDYAFTNAKNAAFRLNRREGK